MKNNPIGSYGISVNKKRNIERKNNIKSNNSFNNILKDKLEENNKVVISKHARQRLSQRNINLSDNAVKKISNAINLADQKGIKDSLIIMDNMVLVANIKSRTIVTAIDKQSMKEKVFTNVDGAVNI